MRSLSIARSTANCRASTLKNCCGSLPERQAFYATSLMCWTATSSMSPIHERFSPASSPWAPTWGCGRWRRGISQAALQTTARNYLRIETLHPAIDAICNAIAALSVFQEYDISDRRHSSSDGQPIERQIQTINARYSNKYFGL